MPKPFWFAEAEPRNSNSIWIGDDLELEINHGEIVITYGYESFTLENKEKYLAFKEALKSLAAKLAWEIDA